MKVYVNGEFKEKDGFNEVFEPGFLFGWGVFEPLRVYDGKAAFLDEHVSRLNNSCRLLSLDIPKTDWHSEINKLLKENNLTSAYVRLTVYKKRKDTGVLIYMDDFRYYVPAAYDNGFTSIISATRRNENDIACKVKTISYLNNRLAWHEAQGKGKDEALMLNLKGNFTGGSRSNLFLMNNGNLITPTLEDGALCGITRQIVLELASSAGLKVEQRPINEGELYDAQEAFVTSSLLEVMSLVSCNDRFIGTGKPGEITMQLHKKYKEKIHG
jgi:branched-chain amino acid aminotransferase